MLPTHGEVLLGKSGEMTLRLTCDLALLDACYARIRVMGEGDCIIEPIEASGLMLVDDRTLLEPLPFLHRSHITLAEHTIVYMADSKSSYISEAERRRRRMSHSGSDQNSLFDIEQVSQASQGQSFSPPARPRGLPETRSTHRRPRLMGRVAPRRPTQPSRRVIDTSFHRIEEILEQIASERGEYTLRYAPHDSVAIFIEDGVVRGVSYQDEPDPYVAFARILALGPSIWHVDTHRSTAHISSVLPVNKSLEAFVKGVLEMLSERAASRALPLEEE